MDSYAQYAWRTGVSDLSGPLVEVRDGPRAEAGSPDLEIFEEKWHNEPTGVDRMQSRHHNSRKTGILDTGTASRILSWLFPSS